MIYVCSGLMGRLDRLKNLASMVKLSDEDKLYIIGDVITPVDNAIYMFEYLIDNPNIILLRSKTIDYFLNMLDKIPPTEKYEHLIRNREWSVKLRASLNRHPRKNEIIHLMRNTKNYVTETVNGKEYIIAGTYMECRGNLICRIYKKEEMCIKGSSIYLNPKDALCLCLDTGNKYYYYDHKSCTVKYDYRTWMKII